MYEQLVDEVFDELTDEDATTTVYGENLLADQGYEEDRFGWDEIEEYPDLEFGDWYALEETCRGFEIDDKNYIRWVQRSLNRNVGSLIPASGEVSPEYRQAVKQFQMLRGINPTGVVDERTQNQLIKANESDPKYVMWVQRALNTRGYELVLGVAIGRNQSATKKAIRDFQQKRLPDLCVDGYVGAKSELRLIQAYGVWPPGHISPRHKPPIVPRPDRPPAKNIIRIRRRCCKEEHRRDLTLHIKRAVKASGMAKKRFRQLAAMTEDERAKSWNNGQEKVWFGSYSRGARRTPFKYVKRTIDQIRRIFLSNKLTIQCYYGNDPGDDISCSDCEAIPCINEPFDQQLCTFGFNCFCEQRDYLNPMQNKLGLPPYKIYLANCWFYRPQIVDLKMWMTTRSATILHEVAHIAGATRLFEEIVGERAVKRLARRNAWGARVNAENYAYYVMSLV